MKLGASATNSEQIAFWNEQGQRWVSAEARLDELIAPHGGELLRVLGLRPGERVLDVGCGCGTLSLEMARLVFPGGTVEGVDVSKVMLERARERSRDAGVDNLRFSQDDAQTRHFDAGSYDVVASRFGVMFFEDPAAAFSNLRVSLAPGGRLGFVCWQPISRNPWVRVPVEALAQIVAPPAPPPLGAPGPFSFGDSERVQRVLEFAGFSEIDVSSLERGISLGGTLEDAVEFAGKMGPASALLRDASEAQHQRAHEVLMEAFRPYETTRGVVVPSASWIVRAVSPA